MSISQEFYSSAEGCMDQYLEELEEGETRTYEEWVQAFVNSENEWWDMGLPKLLEADDFKEILQVNEKFCEKHRVSLSHKIETLLRRYGLWEVEHSCDKNFRQLWAEKVETE